MVDFAAHDWPRILVIDDNRAIHEAFRKILTPTPDEQTERLATTEAALFGETGPDAAAPLRFAVDFAFQGRAGRDLMRRAVEQRRPYVLAFVDVRMPPGWDGVQTIARLWELNPDLQAVLCSAHTDYSPKQLVERLGLTDRLHTLQKPFEPGAVRQLACEVAAKSRPKQVPPRAIDLRPCVARRPEDSHITDPALRSLSAILTAAIVNPQNAA